MKNFKIKMGILAFAAIILTANATFAKTPTPTEKTIQELIQKYDAVKGVDCIVATKGNGLDLIKLMFSKELGKDFMKGVTSITVIDYSSASEKTCIALRKDFEIFKSILKEFDLRDENESTENQHVISYASDLDSNTISDFVIVIEENSSKMLMYMAGKIKID